MASVVAVVAVGIIVVRFVVRVVADCVDETVVVAMVVVGGPLEKVRAVVNDVMAGILLFKVRCLLLVMSLVIVELPIVSLEKK